MHLNNCTLRNGREFQIISQEAPGPCPIVLLADGRAHLLTAELKCPADSDYDLIQHDRLQTRFFNVYRAADGGFVSNLSLGMADFHHRDRQGYPVILDNFLAIHVPPGIRGRSHQLVVNFGPGLSS